MVDPIDIGMAIHTRLMERIGKYVDDPREFSEIARMMDCLVGSAQVRAVEVGLDGSPEAYRSYIREKLVSLGMMPAGTPPPVADPFVAAAQPPCLCALDADGHCAACSYGLKSWLTSFSELQAAYVKKMDGLGSFVATASCDGCRAKYADVTMSKVFLGCVSSIPQQNIVIAMFHALQGVVATLGATQTPLLIKAYADLCRERGW